MTLDLAPAGTVCGRANFEPFPESPSESRSSRFQSSRTILFSFLGVSTCDSDTPLGPFLPLTRFLPSPDGQWHVTPDRRDYTHIFRVIVAFLQVRIQYSHPWCRQTYISRSHPHWQPELRTLLTPFQVNNKKMFKVEHSVCCQSGISMTRNGEHYHLIQARPDFNDVRQSQFTRCRELAVVSETATRLGRGGK